MSYSTNISSKSSKRQTRSLSPESYSSDESYKNSRKKSFIKNKKHYKKKKGKCYSELSDEYDDDSYTHKHVKKYKFSKEKCSKINKELDQSSTDSDQNKNEKYNIFRKKSSSSHASSNTKHDSRSESYQRSFDNKKYSSSLDNESEKSRNSFIQIYDSKDDNYNSHKKWFKEKQEDFLESQNSKSKQNEKNKDEIVYKDIKGTTQENTNKKNNSMAEEPLSKRMKIDTINMRTGGVYIPPGKLKLLHEKIQDKGSEEYQRIAWEALKKSIIGMTNKVNITNITEIVQELFRENIIRGRGILVRALMQAQSISLSFTHVYAALVAVINSKFPEIGELLVKRLIIQYRRGYRRNNKSICISAVRFLAHLLNQEVIHEVLILELITHLLENPTEDSIEIAIATLKECGKKLNSLTSRGLKDMGNRLRDILHDSPIESRTKYLIEVYLAIHKDGFTDYESVPKELDLLEEADKQTHMIGLTDELDGEEILNVFKYDPNYMEIEEKYKDIVKEILGEPNEDQESGSEQDSEEEEEENQEEQGIIDMTENNIVCLRRKIYLTIQSSLDFEECAHKLLKLELKPGHILEMCYMILDCCAQLRTYEKFYGLLGQRFCQLNKMYVDSFTEIFENSLQTIHRVETNKLRNIAKFFAHLLYTDAISWAVLSCIKLNENDTTSSSRIFIKILFQELCEYMGLAKLNERIKDVTLQEAFEGLFPRDDPHNTRFAINFFTSIGLGGLTDDLREHLKNLPKNQPANSEAISSILKVVSSPSSSSDSESSPKRKHKKKKKSKK